MKDKEGNRGKIVESKMWFKTREDLLQAKGFVPFVWIETPGYETHYEVDGETGGVIEVGETITEHMPVEGCREGETFFFEIGEWIANGECEGGIFVAEEDLKEDESE